MKRTPSRAPSPTPTAYSGISNYRTDSYRPIRDRNVPSVPTIDYRLVSKAHFDELSTYLAAYLAKSLPNSRSNARQKLTRLTIQQFHELSTDVYDELVRRKKENEMPFLPVREEFHPKRNQARQKLATLPTSRFEDLSSDVYFELARRYPEFKEDPNGEPSPGSNYDDYPAPDFPSGRQPPASGRTSAGRTSEDRPSDSGYGSVSGRRPSEDRRRPGETDFVTNGSGRRSADNYGPGRSSEDGGYPGSIASRRKPSQDTTRRLDDRDRDFVGRPSGSNSISGGSDSTANAQSATATSGMIIPQKSTMAEEEIKVPYGRDIRESSSSVVDDQGRGRDRGQGDGGYTDQEPDTASEYPSPMTPNSPPAGLSGLSARLLNVEDDDDIPGNRSGDDYLDRYNRSSTTPDRSSANGASNISRLPNGRSSVTDDQERIRREYEYKIATMQSQITTLQRDLGDVSEKERMWKDDESRVKQLEEELATFRRRAEEEGAAMRALRKELDDLQEARTREKERESRRVRDDEEELQILRDRLEKLEDERQSYQGGADAELVEQLRSDMQGLMAELGDLSRRNDELMTAKDADLVVIRDLDNQLKEYKRKYEQAKTELRSIKATSQLYSQAPKLEKPDDQLPVSPDGGLVDIHVTAFVSAIDSLVVAGRSNAPTRVLTPMKAVINAVTAIIDDVRAYERRPQRERADVDAEALRALRDRAEATLSNLTTATRTHATSSGMSPVSLLDAAASHVSATVTEIGKTVLIRKATRAEQEQFAPSGYTGPSTTHGYSPSLRSVDELRGASSHTRRPSTTSSSGRSAGGLGSSRLADSPSHSYSLGETSRRHPPSEHTSSETNSPPPIFDNQAQSLGGMVSDDSGVADGSEDAWAELKPYLEAQNESIVYAIQSVLSGVRSPTPPPSLNENLTQIITIVSSIVAVCNDNLPPANAQQGNDILRELSEHANRLSEVQSMPDLTKESRQAMAKSSFAIANAMKTLTKL